MGTVRRIFVEKKKGYDVYARNLLQDLQENLGIDKLSGVRVLNRYDIEGVSDAEYAAARDTIFAEPPLDFVYDESMPIDTSEHAFAVEYLPGQYDQRADSTAQCIQIMTHAAKRPAVATAQIIVLQGAVSGSDFGKVRKYCINPVDSREASLSKPETLDMKSDVPPDVKVLAGFTDGDHAMLESLRQELGLAMRFEDLLFCQTYFRDTEKRDPTLTEIRVLDTYWSDHCRHTTFLTSIKDIRIESSHYNEPVSGALKRYHESRAFVYGTAPREICLMDMATIGMKELRKRGILDNLDVSDEINACSIVVPVDCDGKREDWLVMFKNETHNHPTEIEPFGGAATCLGGAIRDPLSGRAYVYQAMRVTGSGDPRHKMEETLPGKLPQRKITVLAAQGYSSYGNQIGLATGLVSEIYDEGYVAKRMEIGAVVGAAPKANVVRAEPVPGDIVVLLGGRTGRDGCGGATGSSKEHTEESIETCSAEVQKGNPPTERKIQRLFRNPVVSRMIRRCNDFGAGGVSVAIGELAAGLDIDLDAVPKKYEGLDGTELAISESQERMAVVIARGDLYRFVEMASTENLETAVVAQVTVGRRLKMKWRGATIVDISRDFIDTNGVRQETVVTVGAPVGDGCDYFANEGTLEPSGSTLAQKWLRTMTHLDNCSQRGLVERFDSTIGAGTVLLPYGGKYQATPIECMVAKLPVLEGDTTTGTAMSYGYFPRLSTWSPFHGAVYAVIDAVAKIVAAGGDHSAVRLTLQEYFEKVGTDPLKWGKPFGALLGALYAQTELGTAAIGGKDSMSGTFKDISVPPTLVAFALAPLDVRNVLSPEFKEVQSTVVLIELKRDSREMPDFKMACKNFSQVHAAIRDAQVLSAHAVGKGGVAAAIAKMTFGNRIGFTFSDSFPAEALFTPAPGSLVLELAHVASYQELFKETECTVVGTTTREAQIRIGGTVLAINDLYHAWEQPLEKVFPSKPPLADETVKPRDFTMRNTRRSAGKLVQPRALIAVFPGTNCEYDTARAFVRAGAKPDTFVIKNLTSRDIDESIAEMVKRICQAQILMIPGGFSAGDEPDGSGKFIAAFFRNPRVRDAVNELLGKRDGLGVGICNGFQALIKLGLVPWGEIRDIGQESPTLTFNTIGRHISRMAYTRVCSVKSPWLANVENGDVHAMAISHGEGRFVAPPDVIESLFANGQVATQYVDVDGMFMGGMDGNANGSYFAIEGITSPDGRVFGKMGHSERCGSNVAKNIAGDKDQKLFEAGVAYFG